ncbi:MAG: hypothetical protein ABI867_43610 [Kofleriaceae bacterium]
MELRFPILFTCLAACAAEDLTTTQAAVTETFSLADQKAAVAERDARRKAAYVPNLRSQTKPVDWLFVAYHGQVIDKNFDPVVLDAQTIDTIQVSIFDELYPSLGAKAKAKYGKDLAVLFAAKDTNPYERAEARATAIDGLLAVASATQLERMRWRNDTLRGGIAQYAWQYTLSPSVLEWIRTHGIPVYTPPPGQAYIDACAAQGVPIPPDWPDEDNWHEEGTLAFTFLGGDTHVYTYRDPWRPTDGICFALPRYNEDGSLRVNGIICQNKATGKACFWDNITRRTEDVPARRLGIADYPLRIGTISDGYSLAENCTECHRGDNVFNIHPGTLLDQPDTGVAIRYSPIGRAAFMNPPPLVLPALPPGSESCGFCHSLPSLSSQYCSSVLEDAARVTMPKSRGETPWTPAGWPPTILRPEYESHVRLLSSACGI